MSTSNSPLRSDDTDDAETRSEEVRMRLALEKLGTRSTPPVRNRASNARPGGAAGSVRTAPQRRHKFAREGEVPVEHMPPPVRNPGDLQRELTEERASRQRAEQALAEAQTGISSLQAALSQSERTARAAREAVEEREAAMTGLRAKLQRIVVELEVALASRPAAPKAKARRGTTAQAEARRVQAASGVTDPQPVKWWLPLM